MNEYLISLLLGVVEGLTEFLPVSSTAHLRIAQGLFDLPLDDPFWKMYAVVIQLGAVACVPIHFRSRIAEFLRTFPRGKANDRTIWTHPLSLVMLAFVVTAIPAYLMDKKIGEALENLVVIGWALIIGGVLMWVIDATCTRPTTEDVEKVGLWQAIWIGAAQILSAALPGTSRSMATIAAGQLAGLSRPAALEFSFFLSIPVMFAATLFKLSQAVFKGIQDPSMSFDMTPHRWGVLAVGFVVSFFVAWAVVAWFMNWVRTRGFAPFAIYRLIVGVAVLVAVRTGILASAG